MQISTHTDDQLLIKTFKTLEMLYGIEPSTHVGVYTAIFDWLRTNFGYLTPDDLLQAFSLASAGSILTERGQQITLESYGKPISITYLSNILVPYKAYRRKRNKVLQIEHTKQLRLAPHKISKAEVNQSIRANIAEYIQAARAEVDFMVIHIHYHYINENLYQFTPAEKIDAMQHIEPLEKQRLFRENERKGKFQRLSLDQLRAAQAKVTDSQYAKLEAMRYLTTTWIQAKAKEPGTPTEILDQAATLYHQSLHTCSK